MKIGVLPKMRSLIRGPAPRLPARHLAEVGGGVDLIRGPGHLFHRLSDYPKPALHLLDGGRSLGHPDARRIGETIDSAADQPQ